MSETLAEQLRLAREYALVGNYETSLVYFDGVIATIQRVMRDTEDLREKSQWQKMKEEVQLETKLIKELLRELSVLRRPPGSKPTVEETGDDASSHAAPSRVKRVDSRGQQAPSSRPRAAARKPPVPTSGSNAPARGAGSRAKRVVAGSRPSSVRGAGNAGNGGREAPSGRGAAKGGGGAQPSRRKAPARPQRETPEKRKRAGKGRGADDSDGGGGEGDGEVRPPYSETHSDSPDVELIRMIERDILETDPNVKFDDIAGLEEAKGLIQEAVVLPLLIPDYFQGIRQPWKGVLMFGPPGTGKTLLAKAVATECSTTFFNVTGTTLTSKWRGESEKLVRILFDMARYHAPSTVFFDEIDSLAGARGGSSEHEASRRVKTEMLVQMDGLSSVANEAEGTGQVVVIAATNLPWELDEAFRRRLEKRIYIPLPNKEDRVHLMRISMRSVSLAEDVNLDSLADLTEGYSGADLAIVCRDAAMMSMRKVVLEARRKGQSLEEMKEIIAAAQEEVVTAPVTQGDFLEAIRKVSASVGTHDLNRFSDWMKEFGAT